MGPSSHWTLFIARPGRDRQHVIRDPQGHLCALSSRFLCIPRGIGDVERPRIRDRRTGRRRRWLHERRRRPRRRERLVRGRRNHGTGRRERIVLVHGCRFIAELAYDGLLSKTLPDDEHFGTLVSEKLIYYPTVTREPFRNNGRISHLIESGKLCADIGLPQLSAESDRVMLCGSPHMIQDLRTLLEAQGFEEGNHGEPGHFVIEKAFVEK